MFSSNVSIFFQLYRQSSATPGMKCVNFLVPKEDQLVESAGASTVVIVIVFVVLEGFTFLRIPP